ncbi:MAG: HAMP domain-containing protein [Chloroflexi bacterium]|nr:HAMP domain-containing protein [Chloroflexota bacterium]
MFQSLRWKLIGAFSLTILLTIILSGTISAWMTTSRFDVLVTSESYYLAEEIAPLLEANYAIEGNWDHLGELFVAYPDDSSPPALFEEYWYSDIDWAALVADELKMDEETFFEQWKQAQSLAALSKDRGVDPDFLVQTIVAAEEEVIKEAIQYEELTPEVAEKTLIWIAEDAADFVFREGAEPYDPIDINWTEESVGWIINSLLLNGERLLIADYEGIVIYDSEGEREADALSEPMLEEGAWLWDYKKDEEIGTVIVATGEGYYSAQEEIFLNSVSRTLVVSGFAAGAAALLVGLLFARKITSPVTALTDATHNIANGHWDERLPVQTDDELGQMSAAFNAMAEALETQRSLRNRLVDDVTHELNTPLSVIQLELEALNDGMQSPVEATTHVKREINLLENLVSDLALLTEFGEGKLKLGRQAVDFGELVESALVRWRPQAEAKEISLEVNLSKVLPEVAVDSLRITQVMGNLISNALQHTPQGGMIEISTELSNNTLLTKVRNTGEGIEAKDLPHLFERFYRADNARSRDTGGRGLGLAIVKEIVELHGGRVWAESVAGEGSLFGFELPI